MPPQQGRRFVITGANGGVGLQTARILGSRGAELVLACRSVEKGEAAARLVPGYDAGRVVVRRLDVADLGSVRSFAEALLAEYDAIDVLINNAGVLGAPFGLTVDGLETHFATNHLGHFALANLLLPAIRDRVVVTSSREHRRGQLDLDDLAWEHRPYGAFAAYAQSKLADLLFMSELQRRLTAAGSDLRAVGAHPGASATNITSGSGKPARHLDRLPRPAPGRHARLARRALHGLRRDHGHPGRHLHRPARPARAARLAGTGQTQRGGRGTSRSPGASGRSPRS